MLGEASEGEGLGAKIPGPWERALAAPSPALSVRRARALAGMREGHGLGYHFVCRRGELQHVEFYHGGGEWTLSGPHSSPARRVA